MAEETENSLPAIIPPAVIVEPIYLDEVADFNQVKRADVKIFNSQLSMLNSLWKEVRSIKTALALHDRYMEMIERRRNILGMEYGASTSKNSKSAVYEPVD